MQTTIENIYVKEIFLNNMHSPRNPSKDYWFSNSIMQATNWRPWFVKGAAWYWYQLLCWLLINNHQTFTLEHHTTVKSFLTHWLKSVLKSSITSTYASLWLIEWHQNILFQVIKHHYWDEQIKPYSKTKMMQWMIFIDHCCRWPQAACCSGRVWRCSVLRALAQL